MLEPLLIRSRAVPPEQPRRRGATSVGPERDRFGVLKAILGRFGKYPRSRSRFNSVAFRIRSLTWLLL